MLCKFHIERCSVRLKCQAQKHNMVCLTGLEPRPLRVQYANNQPTNLLLTFYLLRLIVNSSLWLLHISLKISYENLVLDQNDNFSQISLSILITCLMDNVWIF